MGCDIHSYIEVFDDKKKKWVLAQGLRESPYEEDGKHSLEVPYADRFHDRNYILFGILTNGKVRENGYGFFEPKGFPVDASEFVRKEFEEYGFDAHTPSYLNFQEIEDFLVKNEIKVKVSGMIEKDRLVKIKKLLKKKDYTQNELDKLLYPYYGMTTMENCASFEIEVPIKFEIDSFLRYIDNAEKYQWGFSGGKDKIRILYWFDN